MRKCKVKHNLKRAVAFTMAAAMAVTGNGMNGLFFEGGIEVSAAENDIELSDADINKLYSKVSYQRQSVHDPSIIPDRDGTYHVFGSHMGVAATDDLMNWSSVTGEEEGSNLYGKKNDDGTVSQVSFNEAFKENELKGETTLYSQDGTPYIVNFGTYNINEWIKPNTIKGNQWAPDIIYNTDMNKWCMYLSLNGEKWNSSIILLTADNEEGPYVYQAPVVFTGFQSSNNSKNGGYKNTDLQLVIGEQSSLPAKYDQGGNWGTYWPHAIDPTVFYDDNGKLWIAYGSWSGGIYTLELDEKTGLRDYSVKYDSDFDTEKANVTTDEYFGKKIAGGYYVSGEGPYIEKIGSKYCLFMSYGFYSPEGGYEMHVFYSDNPDGPYVDTTGTSAIYKSAELNYSAKATTTRGQKIIGNYKWESMDVAEIAQGHNSAYQAADGRAYLIYHTKFDDGTAGHQLRVHELFTTKEGYIVASPYEYSSSNSQITSSTTYSNEQLAGSYDVIVHKYKTKCKDKDQETEVITPVKVKLNADGTVSGALSGTWSNESGTPYATIVLDGKTYSGVFAEQNVSGSNISTMCFTILDSSTGLCVWGSKEIADNVAVAKNAQNFKATIPAKTYADVVLPTEVTDGATVTWSSSDESIISADGKVTAPAANTTVTLTAKIAKGDYYYNKVYTTEVVAGGIAGGDDESDLDASYKFEGNLVNEKDASQVGEAMAQASGTKPSYEYSSELGSKVLHQYFGYNDASSISYTKFVNPLKGKNLTGATVSLWLNRKDTDVFDAIWGVLDEDASDGVSGRVYFTPNTYLGYNGKTDGVEGWFDANHAKYPTDAIATNEWHLVTVSMEANDFIIALDGKKIYDKDTLNSYDDGNKTTDATSNYANYGQSVLKVLSSASDFYLGYGSWWGSSPLLMDNLKIYSRALTEPDIAKLYSDEQKEVQEALAGDYVDTSDYIYYQDYNKTDVSAWKSQNASANLTLESDTVGDRKNYIKFAFNDGRTNSRSAYTSFGTLNLPDKYQVSFDTKLTAGNNQQTQLALVTSDYNYKGNDIIDSGYIWSMSSVKSTTWTLSNSDTVVIPKDTWVNITTDISTSDGVAKVTIKNDANTVLYSGTVTCNSKAAVNGIYMLSGRCNGVSCFDNVRIKSSLADGLLGEYLFNGSLKDSYRPSVYEAEVKYAAEENKSEIATDPLGSRGSVMEMKGTYQATGYLELPIDYVNDIDNAFSVTMWAKANNSKVGQKDDAGKDLGTIDGSAGLFNFKTTESGCGFISVDGSLHPWINDGQDPLTYLDRASDVIQLSSDKWQQITMSIDFANSKLCMYVDGVLTETITTLGGTNSFASLLNSIKNAKAIQIGTLLPWWSVWDFRGYVDDIRLYNRVLTATDAAQLYNLAGDDSVVIKAQESVPEYTIAFDTNGGTGSMDNLTSCKMGEDYVLTANAYTRENYTFAGWSKTEDGKVDYADGETVKNLTKKNGEIVTLYAVWLPNYTIAFDGNTPKDAEVQGAMSDITGIGAEKVALPNNAFKCSGYTFMGWATASDTDEVKYANKASVSALSKKAGDTVTLYAVWMSNETLKNVNVKDGLIAEYLFENLKDSKNPDKEVTIVSTSEDTKSQIATDASRGNVMEMRGTYQATGYLELPKEYLDDITDAFTVTMWAKANNSKVGQKDSAGKDLGTLDGSAGLFNFKPSNTAEGWGFIGIDGSLHPWINDGQNPITYLDRASDNIQLSSSEWQQITMSIDFANSKMDIYIDGQLTETITTLGGTNSFAALLNSIKNAQAIQIGTLLPWWATWDFRGYVDDVRLYNTALTDLQVKALYAGLEPDETAIKKSYDVEFNANGGTGDMQSQHFVFDNEQKLSRCTFTKDGYTFKGWSDAEDGEVLYKDAEEVKNLSDEDNSKVTLYAVWEDTIAPTGKITVSENVWESFLEIITFGIYEASQKEITVDASDLGSGMDKVLYVITSDGTTYSLDEVKALSDDNWKEYIDSEKPVLNKDAKNVIYVKLVDKAGNVSYLSSDGIVEDETPAPTKAPEADETPAPTEEPTKAPEADETPAPTEQATEAPTSVPTSAPTSTPAPAPVVPSGGSIGGGTGTMINTPAPVVTAVPSQAPTTAPSEKPSEATPVPSEAPAVTAAPSNGTVTETVKDEVTGNVTETTTTTEADKQTVIKKVTSNDTSATLVTTVVSDAEGKVTQAEAVIYTGSTIAEVANTSNVAIPESYLSTVKESGIDSVDIHIEQPTVDAAKADGSKKVSVTVTVPETQGVTTGKVILTNDSITSAKDAGKDLVINVNGKDSYKVTIPQSQLKKMDSEVNVAVQTKSISNTTGKQKKNIEKALKANNVKNKNAYVVTVPDNATSGGMKVTAAAKASSIKSGSTVYVYRYNAKTGKLQEIANSKQKVSKSGTVSIEGYSGKSYVVSSKKLSGKNVESLLDRTKVSVKKIKIKKGKTTKISVSLASDLQKKSSVKKNTSYGKEAAVITYSSSNKSKATVSKNGKIKAKKKGTVKITAKIKLASGKTKKVTKKIKIK